MNPLLLRQFRKHAPHFDESSEACQAFLAAVSATYDEFLEEQRHLEHVLAVTSHELTDANERLRREADSEIAALHGRFQQTLELQQGMIVCAQKTARGFELTFCRGALARRLGLAPENVEGRLLTDVAAPANAPALLAAYERAWAGEEFSLAYTHARTGLEILVHGRPRREQGIVREIIVSYADITEVQRTAARLREREQLLSSINENLASTIIYRAEHRPDGSLRCDYVSPGTHEFVGLAADEFIAQPVRLFALIHAEDLAGFRAELERVLRTGDTSNIVVRLRHAGDGAWRWMQFRSRLVERRPDGAQVRDGIVTDITALKKTEAQLQDLNENLEQLVRARTAQLRESEARFRFLFEEAPDAIFVHDVDQACIVDCNSNFLRLLDCTAEDMRRHRMGMLSPDTQPDGRDSNAAARDYIERVLAGEMVRYEWTYRTLLGRTVIGEVRLALLPAPAGRRLLRGSIIDITARKQAEAALRENEEKFRAVFDHSPVIVCLLSVPDGRIVEANPAAEAAFGFTRDTAIGRTSAELNVWTDPAQRQVYLDLLARDGAVRAMEARMRRSDGSEFTALYSGTLIKIGGHPYSLNILQDITARKESEQSRDHLLAITRATLESTTDGILVVDDGGRFQTYNRLFAQMWRFPDGLLASHPTTEVLRHVTTQIEEPEKFLEKIRALNAQPLVESFDTIRFKDGRVFERYSRPQLVNQQPAGRVWSFRDVTERLRAEQARAKLEETIRQAQKIESIGTLAGGIAHDFNNILTGIFGFIELARHELPPDHSAQAWLGQAFATSQRAKELVRQILTFSRRHEGARMIADLGPIVAEALRLLRSTLPVNVELVSRFELRCPPVLADATQIHQVVMNLCTNAWHALPARGGRITVSLEPCAPPAELARSHPALGPGPAVRLAVTDNGAGMDAATLPRIFEPFFTTKETGKGTGLGLAVVHGIVGTHGGAIQVHSTPGQGSTFEIFFPASVAAESAQPEERDALPRGRGQHLLCVDDDYASRVAIEHALKSLGYVVTACEQSDEAWREFRAAPDRFALVITDLAMPGLDGRELAAQILQVRPTLPVLVVSGLIEPREQLALLQSGVREVVHKPPTMEEIAHAIARHVPP